MTPGGAVTESGQVITLPTSGSKTGNTLITSTLSLGQQGQITSVLIGGQTLTAGGKVTVGGDVLSLASTGGASGIMVVSTVTVMGSLPTTTKKSGAEGVYMPLTFLGGQVLLVVLGAFWGLY